MFCFLLIIICCLPSFIENSSDNFTNETELVLLHVIFRHGARTTYSFYPNDPYINETFYPIGLGGLTNEGKLGEYKLGGYLKNLYGDFIGADYTEEKVYIRSTDVTRTKMSAQLVLAGLFPPSEIQQWNPNLLWQPIPISYKSAIEEDLFHPYDTCPNKINIISNQINIPEVQELYIKPFQDVFNYIEEKSGKTIKTPADIQEMYFILKTEDDMNYTLPEWTKEIYPEPIESIAGYTYGYFNYDPKVKTINSGYLLKKILNDTMEKISKANERKIFLYSGHESTLGYMLNALNVYEVHVPAYGSAISFEIHKKDDKYFVKLLYRTHPDAEEPINLVIPGCQALCPLENFIELTNDLIPTLPIKQACHDGTTDKLANS